MAPTPKLTPNSNQTHTTPVRTPQSRQRLYFPKNGVQVHQIAPVPTEHPVEVIGRIRDYPDCRERNHNPSLEISSDGRSVKVHTDIGYRDFTIDGISVSEKEELAVFYEKFVKSRVEDVRVGSKCTIMMYGPTGSGKSHTMFGSPKEPGIVYRALRDILCDTPNQLQGETDIDTGFKLGLFVRVAVLEIYNEEIYDLLPSNINGGAGNSNSKGSAQKTKVEIIGRKAKNPTYITGNEAGKISREVSKIEKRRVVKSTLCNERSSRSHCVIILDVPSVGGRLMLVDMAGSENIEAAGQTGFEAKIQTAKINQGNIALKRVVESIANGDSHVPFRDSKLTMLLQDSFEDDKSKILMILCASPDPREMHKTISTLEYGAKAKCIIRVAHVATPKDSSKSHHHVVHDESSVMLNSRIALMNQYIAELQREKRAHEEEARKSLLLKDKELAQARAHKALLEQTVLTQQEEIESLRKRLSEVEGLGFCTRFAELADQSMVKSMELDFGDQVSSFDDVKEVREDLVAPPSWTRNLLPSIEEEASDEIVSSDEVDKEVVEEKIDMELSEEDRQTRIENIFRLCGNYRELEKKQERFGDENSEPNCVMMETNNKNGGLVDVYVKWEVSKGSSANLISKIRVSRDLSLADLRKIVEAYFEKIDNNQQNFTFLLLKDPSGGAVTREKEGEVKVTNLPICSNEVNGFLASLRPVKRANQKMPFGSLENKLGSPLVGLAV